MNGDEQTKRLSQVVLLAITRRRGAIVHALAERFFEEIATKGFSHPDDGSVKRSHGDCSWLEISTLSQLRRHVGGRFEYLKARWIKAGFPLKACSNTRASEAAPSFDAVGWKELALWINEQGFEVELSGAEQSSLFRLRKSL